MRLTLRQYLLTAALSVPGTSVLMAAEAVASAAIEHPEWDMNEVRTVEEWAEWDSS